MRQLVMFLAFSLYCFGQQSELPPSQADAANLTGLTTPVEVAFSHGGLTSGSGFFYFVFAPDDGKQKEPHWQSVQHIYVVTAKHVVQPKRLKEIIEFKYALRVTAGDHVDWHTLKLNNAELGERLHLCKKENVDVAVIDVTDKLSGEALALLAERAQLLTFGGLSSRELPGRSILQAQPGDEVIVIGYPKGIFDTFNKLPVLKTGLLNTPIGMHFNGLDAFLIDFKYHAGFSGGLIISRPTRIAYGEDGRLQSSNIPQYLFLGVYQGEEVWNDTASESADLGLGWYYYNVEEAINNPPFGLGK